MTLSPATRTRLAKALHAYVMATPARDLPRDLKRLQSFRSQALAPHAAGMVAALDDQGLRDRVLEWLDSNPAMPKQDAELLRLALERSDGWEEKAESGASGMPTRSTTDPAEKLQGRLEREKQRVTQAKDDVRRAREDARRAKEEAQRARQAEKKSVADLNRQLASTTRDLEKAHAALDKATVDLARVRDAADRERRRDRSTTEKALAEKEELKSQLGKARKEIAELDSKLRETERMAKKKRASSTNAAPTSREPAKRKRLPVPKGRFDDAPETLSSWLSAPDVRVLIDGYNVTKAQSGFGDLKLEAQRERLVDTATQLARKHSVPMTIVFDGSEEPVGSKRRSRQGVKVEYSKPDEIADDHLIAVLEALPPDPVVVVTNDKELQHRAKRKGATVAGSDQFLALRR